MQIIIIIQSIKCGTSTENAMSYKLFQIRVPNQSSWKQSRLGFVLMSGQSHYIHSCLLVPFFHFLIKI